MGTVLPKLGEYISFPYKLSTVLRLLLFGNDGDGNVVSFRCCNAVPVEGGGNDRTWAKWDGTAVIDVLEKTAAAE